VEVVGATGVPEQSVRERPDSRRSGRSRGRPRGRLPVPPVRPVRPVLGQPMGGWSPRPSCDRWVGSWPRRGQGQGHRYASLARLVVRGAGLTTTADRFSGPLRRPYRLGRCCPIVTLHPTFRRCWRRGPPNGRRPCGGHVRRLRGRLIRPRGWATAGLVDGHHRRQKPHPARPATHARGSCLRPRQPTGSAQGCPSRRWAVRCQVRWPRIGLQVFSSKHELSPAQHRSALASA